MTVGRKRRGWQNGDPPGSEKPRGKSSYRRKGSRDGKELTPSEQRQKNELMRQFCKIDGPKGTTEAYRSAPCWDRNGRLRP